MTGGEDFAASLRLQPFGEIYARAAERHGGEAAVAAALPEPLSPGALAHSRDDRWLAQMTRCIFQAGFVWRVVEHKWNEFEALFFGFEPHKIVLLSPEQLDRFASDPRIIRNRQKVLCVPANAQFILDIAASHGSFGRFIGDWPQHDLIGLFRLLRRRGARLGGMTGQRVLRNMGKDTFIVTGDVVRCLQRAGLDIADAPDSLRHMRLIQAAFDRWHADTGLPYCQLSRICSLSVDSGR